MAEGYFACGSTDTLLAEREVEPIPCAGRVLFTANKCDTVRWEEARNLLFFFQFY